MADDKAFEDDPLGGGSYSQLLFGDDDVVGLDPIGCFNFNSHFSSENPSKMLCFGDYGKQSQDMVLVRPALKCGVTCSDSSPASSTTSDNNKINSLSKKSNKKRNGSGKESSMLQNSTGGAVAADGNQKNSKKAKADNSPAGHAKAKKLKLGERITALQQLVSPFGKTDTASVLHEAMGYIRFLHDQVQVLCSPYLQRLPSSDHLCEPIDNGQGEPNKDLRSRGLCLVPVELTSHVAETNGADFWSPAMVNNESCNQ